MKVAGSRRSPLCQYGRCLDNFGFLQSTLSTLASGYSSITLSTMCVPINPLPPVTNIRIFPHLSFQLKSRRIQSLFDAPQSLNNIENRNYHIQGKNSSNGVPTSAQCRGERRKPRS